jgi:excisionase family DNA binding protein
MGTSNNQGNAMPTLLTIREVAELLGMSESSVRRAWYDGNFPKPIRLGRRGLRWRRDDVESFLANKPGVQRPQQPQKV